MDRRTFISKTGATGLGFGTIAALADVSRAQDGVTTEFSAGSPDGPALQGNPIVSGPAPETITILQPLQRYATGFLEYTVGDEQFQRVDTENTGLLPFEQHVLKFRLPPLPPGRKIRYRITARIVGWVPVREFFHGKIVIGQRCSKATSP